MNNGDKQFENIEVLKNINFVDSYLVGLQVDICKIRLFMAVDQSPILEKIGLDPNFDYLQSDFLDPQELSLNIHHEYFSEFEVDGVFSDVDMGRFDFDELELSERGYGKSGAFRYSLSMKLGIGKISFTFSGLNLGPFKPEELRSV